MSVNVDVIVFFLNYGLFTAICKPDLRFMVYKIYVLINSNFLFYKTISNADVILLL